MDDQTRLAPVNTDSMTAIQQIERKVDTVRNRLTAMEDIADAAGKLYAGLNKEQKAVADQLLPGTLPALYSGLGSTFNRGRRPPGSVESRSR